MESSRKMALLLYKADKLYKVVDTGDIDGVIDILKKGANVNVLPSCGQTVLGRAAQLGNLKIVCLLLDAEKFYNPALETECEGEILLSDSSRQTYEKTLFRENNPSSSRHKCCSPSIDSETCTCSDEVSGLDASDTNAGQHSDWETNCYSHELPKNIANREDGTDGEHEPPFKNTGCNYNSQNFSANGLSFDVYSYRVEEEEDTEESSGPVVSSTEDSDSAMGVDRRHQHHPRHSSIVFHRTIGQGRANIVSSDSEFETDNRRRRRHGKPNYRNYRHYKDHSRHKSLVPPTNPWLGHLRPEYLSLDFSSQGMQQRKCDINQHDAYGRTALHYAIQHSHTYIVKMLIDSGVKVDIPDHAQHMTPLHAASQRGFTEAVHMLLEGGANVNSKMVDKSSPLHIAASWGYIDIVETLLDRGAKIDSSDGSDRTPLFLSVSRAHYRVVQILIKRGAKVNIEEIHGYSPLCEAVWMKDAKLVSILLKAGAKVTQSHYLLHYVVLHRQEQLVNMLLAARCIVNLRDDNGDTPLIIAARTCQPHIIHLLLQHGANVNYPNKLTGTTPLHEAVEGTRDAQFKDFFEIFRVLRTFEAKLDVDTITPGDTALYRALLLEKNMAAALLIKEGCDVNHSTPLSTPDYLRMTALRGNAPLATLIIYAGVNLQNATWLQGNHAANSVQAYLAHIRRNPFNLVDLCRIFLRRWFGERARTAVSDLEIPARLKRYLMLEDIDSMCVKL